MQDLLQQCQAHLAEYEAAFHVMAASVEQLADVIDRYRDRAQAGGADASDGQAVVDATRTAALHHVVPGNKLFAVANCIEQLLAAEN